MKIKTKLIVYSVLAVWASTTMATIGAIVLTINQTNRQNQARLENALLGFERQLFDVIEHLETKYDQYLQTEMQIGIATSSIETIYLKSPTIKSRMPFISVQDFPKRNASTQSLRCWVC